MFVFHLLSGYRGSGKDSFYYYLQKNSPYNFTILKSDDSTDTVPFYNETISLESKIPETKNSLESKIPETKRSLESKIPETKRSLRVGLADEVKTLVHEELGIKIDNLQLLDLAKNYLQFYDNISGKYFPLRHFYIKTGMNMRTIDPDFWCKKGLEKIYKSFPDGVKSEEVINVFITDYRFPNEKAYFEKFGKVITYRIFSPYVNGLNTIGVESEHSLDNEVTDYLVLRNPEDFSDAISIFPFYKKYKL
jgi:hypothetical protein